MKFKTASRRARGKAQDLWNTQSRSTKSADIIKGEMKNLLVVPNATRWKSTYNSVVALNKYLENHREECHIKLHGNVAELF